MCHFFPVNPYTRAYKESPGTSDTSDTTDTRDPRRPDGGGGDTLPAASRQTTPGRLFHLRRAGRAGVGRMTANAEAQALALDALHDALSAAVNARRRVPCRVPGHGAAWTSDAYEERAEAAEACAHCPILEPCRAAGGADGALLPSHPYTRAYKESPEVSAPSAPEACSVCGQPLDPALAATGESSHPNCEADQ